MTLNKALVRTPRPSRQIVVLCDGTNANLTGGRADTLVVTLAELLAAHPDPQRVVMYDPGVGHSAELPGAGMWDRVGRWWARVEGLIQGRGVFENIVEGYAFIVRHWQPGDEIFVFGYSRGAFTARSIAGLVNRFGVVRPESESVYTTLLSIYLSREKPGDPASQQAIRLFTPEDARKVRVQYVGVWDTVEAVGLPPFRARISVAPTLAGKRFMHVRQALALDERRRMYQPRIYEQPDGAFETAFRDIGSVQQRWFRGAHADLGSQVPHGEAGLGCEAFHWIVSEAVCNGLTLRDSNGPLNTEVAVERAVRGLPVRASSKAELPWGGRAMLHDALQANALWALTGLAPRDPRLHLHRDKPDQYQHQPMKEHVSVEARHRRVPTAWQLHGAQQSLMRWIPLVLAIALGLLAALFAGHTLMRGDAGIDVLELLRDPWPKFEANGHFQRWQWLGALQSWSPWFDTWRDQAQTTFRLAPRALLWDFVLIACYAYVLARAVSWAFARCVGQRRANEVPALMLRRLGLALPLAVAADIGENVLSLVTLLMLRGGMDVLPLFTGVLMALASIAKWLGIFGAITMWLLGIFGPRRWLPVVASVSEAGLQPQVALAPHAPAPGLEVERRDKVQLLVASPEPARDAEGFDVPVGGAKREL